MSAAGIIFSNLSDNTLSTLTADRTVAAIPFACRYRLVDFPLSAMVNGGITNVSIVTNYNYRSLGTHIGSGKDWDLARRNGGIHVVSPFHLSNPTEQLNLYKTHLEALQSMKSSIRSLQEDYIVMSDCSFIFNPDIKALLRRHEESEADMTILTIPCPEDWSSVNARLLLSADEKGRVESGVVSREAVDGHTAMCVDFFILGAKFLRKILADAEVNGYTSLSKDVICRNARKYRFRVEEYTDPVLPVGNFNDYFTGSIRLTQEEELRRSILGAASRPVLTKIHNSAPVSYREGCSVQNSMIADGCVIEGTVENSILFRNVKVGRGSVVKNSILFGNTYVGENSTLNCVVADKDVSLGDDMVLSGHMSMPLLIPKGRKV